ncbi:MAG: hypothetical protein OXI46_03660 [Gemmatimonadota bacterium]|nr:hypothetical protein [Gemmatimonadota bacterium]
MRNSCGAGVHPIPVEAARYNAGLSVSAVRQASYLDDMKDVLDADGQDYAT